MNRAAFPVGLLCSVLMAAFSLDLRAGEPAADPNANPAANSGQATSPGEKELDKRQMLQIWKAIMEYKKAHGQVPDYLSDLVPDYLPDKAVLVSPLEPKKRISERDPKLPCSYSYEFRATEFAGGGRMFRDVKEEQMKEFGPVVPILRCGLHGGRMNVSYSGDYFESPLIWESSPAAQELIKKLGVGPGFDTGDFAELQVVDEQSGAALAGAEVRLTQRQYHFLPLPDRTLRTDAEGKVRIPLGSPQPPSRQLTVAVFKAGYFAPPEKWREETLPTQRTWRMTAASTIGGVVQDHDGHPLAGARVAVMAAPGTVVLDPAPGFNDAADPSLSSLVPVDTYVTDAQGRWHCESVPKDFVKLLLAVNHPLAWETRYRTGAQEPTPTVDREALLAQTAELRLEPPVAIQGVALAPDGSPLANEEVTVAPAWRQVSANQPEYTQWLFLRDALQHQLPKNVQTDATGHFTVPWRYPADLLLSVSPKNLAQVARAVTVAPGLEPIQLKATTRRRITGQVHDSNGQPVPKARVTFIGWADATLEQEVATTDSKGEFTWDTAPSDQIGLTFTANGFSPSTEWIPADKKDAVQVELRR
ncbi:MAG: carboxypeptidase-like regulatory domain-containing protein [Chthoniobacter sp.]|uniref:carboxypeptidase-like regulatory domain-containing protein n=1 Tax=Chthoniobacter sp. TaxID=2510640 RepID=UPI0032AB397E